MSRPYRITVLSDTHMPKKAKELPDPLLEDLFMPETGPIGRSTSC